MRRSRISYKDPFYELLFYQSKKSDRNLLLHIEAMLDPEYKKKLANDLAFKQEQLSNAQTSKPKEASVLNEDSR